MGCYFDYETAYRNYTAERRRLLGFLLTRQVRDSAYWRPKYQRDLARARAWWWLMSSGRKVNG